MNERISERDFAKLVLSYADMNDQRRKKYLKRIKKTYGAEACIDSRVCATQVSADTSVH